MAYVERTSRIGTHKFDLNPLSSTDLGGAIGITKIMNGFEDLVPFVLGNEKVDESRACYLCF